MSRLGNGVVFQIFQDVLCTRDDLLRQSCKFGDVDAVTFVRSSRDNLAQKDDLITVFAHGNVVIFHSAPCDCKFREFMIMGGELGSCAAGGVIQQKFRDRPGDGKSVECACSASDLIQNYDAFRGGVVQDVRGLDHFHHEGALSACDVVGCTDAREDPVRNADMRACRREEGTHLRHDDKKRGLADVGGFSRHIGAGDDHHAVVLAVQKRIIRDKPFSFHGAVKHRMAPGTDVQEIVVGDLRAAVGVALGAVGERAENVYFGECGSAQLNLRRECPCKSAQVLKQLNFQCFRLVFGTENAAFHFLEFRRDEAFAVGQGLFADVVVRDGGQMGFRDLDEIAEHAVVVDFQRLDSAPLLFLRLQFRDPSLAVRRGGAERIQFRMVSRADHAAVGDGRGRFVDDRAQDFSGKLGHFADVFTQAFHKREIVGGKQRPDRGDHFETVREREHVAGIDGSDVEARDDAFEIAHRAHGFPQFRKRQRIVLENADHILPFDDPVHVLQRLQQPAAHQAASHRRAGPVEDVKKRVFL